MYEFCFLFLLFIIYSFIGFVVEIIDCSIITKRLVLNRGFFLGPYLPIYGVCCLVMSKFLTRYDHDIVALYTMSMFICTIIEFITSYILEKIFKVRWWDYSDKKFNIAGRVCMENALLFGLGGVFLVKIIDPIIYPFLFSFNENKLVLISCIVMLFFFSDLVVTLLTLSKIKISANKYKNHDATEEIKLLVRKKIEDSFFVRHLLNAFPKMSGRDLKIFMDLKKKNNEFIKKIEHAKEKYKIGN